MKDVKIMVGDFVKVKNGAYKELVKRGWHSNVPNDIDGQAAKVSNDYSGQPEPHVGIRLAYSDDEIGVPVEFLEAIV